MESGGACCPASGGARWQRGKRLDGARLLAALTASLVVIGVLMVATPGAQAESKRVGTHWTLTVPGVEIHRPGRVIQLSVVVTDAQASDEGCCVQSQGLIVTVASRGH